MRLTHVAANAVAANVAANAAANVAAKLLAAVHVTHAISLLNVNFSNDNCSSQVLCIQSCAVSVVNFKNQAQGSNKISNFGQRIVHASCQNGFHYMPGNLLKLECMT